MNTPRVNPARKEAILRRVHLIGGAVEAFARDLYFLLETQPRASALTNLVGHCLREISSALRVLLLPDDASSSSGTGSGVQKAIRQHLGIAKPETDLVQHIQDQTVGTSPSADCCRESIARLFDCLGLNEPEGSSHRATILAVLENLDLLNEQQVVDSWLRLEGLVKHTRGHHSYAHRRGVLPPREPDEDFWSRWSDAELLLDKLLERVEERYITWLKRASALAKGESPNPDVLVQELPQSNVVLSRFFSELEDPAWLPHLQKHGYFDAPSQPWPQGLYLERIAESDPEAVLNVLLELDTNDHWLRGQFFTIALRLPSDGLALWAEREIGWLEQQRFFGIPIPDRGTKVAVELARSGYADLAVQWLNALSQFALDDSDDDRRGSRKIRMRFEGHYFGALIEQCLPALVDAAPVATLEVLSQRLEDALARDRHSGERGPPEDNSHIWLSGDLTSARHYSVKEQLVAAVAEATLLAANQSVPWLALSDRLSTSGWHVFKRVELRTLLEMNCAPLEVVEERLSDANLLELDDTRREYHLLAAKFLPRVGDDVRDRFFRWMENGPEASRFIARHIRWNGQPPSPEVLEERANRWRLRHLWPLREVLDEAWRRRTENLVARYEEPDDALDASGIRTWFGPPQSPISSQSIDELPVADVIDYLAKWKPPEEKRGGVPDREGLARALWEPVQNDPSRFVGQLSRFRSLHPQYGSGVLHGLANALTKKNYFDWHPVLDFCRWIVEQGPDQEPHGYQVEDWGAVREIALHLLARGLDTDDSLFPGDDPRVVEVLIALLNDPDPTPNREANWDNDSPVYELTLNCMRGRSLRAIIRWLAWRDRHAAREKRARPSLDHVDVKNALERHLMVDVEPSVGVRAAYGQGLAVLHLVDRVWTLEALPKIFPLHDVCQRHWYAAWESYICFVDVYDDVAEMMLPHYSAAMDRLEPTEAGRASYLDGLGSHLAVMYWREMLDRSDDGILARFFSRAPVSAKCHFWSFVGRSVARWDDEPPRRVFDGLMALWDWRASQSDVTDSELKRFGWLFHSKKFPLDWSFERLKAIGSKVGPTDADVFVLEDLLMYSADSSSKVIECIGAMLEAVDFAPGFRWVHKNLAAILERCRDNGDETVRAAVRRLANKLLAHGFPDFESLAD